MDAKELMNRIPEGELLSDQQIRDRERLEAQERAASKTLRELRKSCPKLYGCSLKSYKVTNARQKMIMGRLMRHVSDVPAMMARKQSFLWHGSVGTGKDHLAMSMLKAVAWHGYTAKWAEATDFFDQLSNSHRNSISTDEVFYRYVSPDALCLSDPVFSTNWTEAKADAFRKLVRKRWNKGRPTWITANVKSLEDISKAVGEDVLDRLKDGCEVFTMTWDSSRGMS